MLWLMHWLSGLPLPFLHMIGGPLGWIVYGLSPTYRRRLVANATLAGLTPSQRRASVVEAGKLVTEIPWVLLRPPGRLTAAAVQWRGEALIERALGSGRGLVILTPHMGCFEMCAQAYAERYGERQPLTVLYRPARKAWLREFEETARERPGLKTAPASLSGVRLMLRALKRGESVGLLPDQVPPEGLGVWAPFFGKRAYTMTLAARLVQQTGADLVLMWGERLPRGAGFVLHVSEAPALPAGADELACASIINRAMERLIAQKPEQYLWGYHRYKTPRRGALA
jgi:KDO2-lipid IV(A) lauroyltransferase